MAQNDLAKRRWRHALPIEDRNAEKRFELLEAASEIGLRHAQRLRSPAKMSMLGERLYNFELANSGHFNALCVSNDIGIEIRPAASIRASLDRAPTREALVSSPHSTRMREVGRLRSLGAEVFRVLKQWRPGTFSIAALKTRGRTEETAMNIHLRSILASSVLASAHIDRTCSMAQAQVQKPNIVLIVSDDFGYGDMGATAAARTVASRRPASTGLRPRACSSGPSTASRAARQAAPR